MTAGRTALAALALVVIVAAGCGAGGDGASEATSGGPAAAAAPATVTIRTFLFQPDPITVDAGTTVVFENTDGTTHTVTAGTREQPAPEDFDESLDQGDTAEVTFDEPGVQPYFCAIHNGPGMTGEVVVRG